MTRRDFEVFATTFGTVTVLSFRELDGSRHFGWLLRFAQRRSAHSSQTILGLIRQPTLHFDRELRTVH
jgi:hypothetical protein